MPIKKIVKSLKSYMGLLLVAKCPYNATPIN